MSVNGHVIFNAQQRNVQTGFFVAIKFQSGFYIVMEGIVRNVLLVGIALNSQ